MDGGSEGGIDGPEPVLDAGSEATIDGSFQCLPGEARIVGSVDGVALAGTYAARGMGFVSDSANVTFGLAGNLFVDGISSAWPIQTESFSRAALRMPDEAPNGGSWYCAGEGSTLVTADFTRLEATLHNVTTHSPSALPVNGSVNLCFGDASCGGAGTFESSLEGAAFTTALANEQGAFIPDEQRMELEYPLTATGGGILVLHSTVDPLEVGIATGPVLRAFFVIPAGLPDAGAIYLAGNGSTVTYQGGLPPTPLSASLVELTRIGACEGAAGDGSLSLCMEL
jgi:hypothetical protein